jgi:DNA-binding NarL/FixJ family response regulator
MSDSVIRVVLVDDQPLFRAGVRMVVDSQPDLEVVAEADDGAAGAAAALEQRADVVLMDLRMPGVDGIEATRLILAPAPTTPRVIVLTTFDFDEAAVRAIRAGASGFVLKDADPEFLLSAIRTVHAGDAVVSAAAVRELFEHVGTAAGPGGAPTAQDAPAGQEALAALTAREKEIFALAARGLSNAEIASAEFLSEATVKTHVSRVLAKLRLRDRVQLVVFAHEHGLV